MVFQMFLLLFSVLGLLHICRALMELAWWVWASFLRPMRNLKEYGPWAIVTGSTDGIGKAIAFRLARHHGLNLVLVGRNPSKLRSVSSEILKMNRSTEVRSIEVDLAGDINEGMEKIREGIEGLDIGILINNAGTGYPYARFLHEADEELVARIIRVNVEFTTRLTHLVLPAMVKKKKGAIVNIGSASGSLLPASPLATIYSATKAYVDKFSRSLHVEYKQHGIDIQCQAPMYVATKMTKMEASFFTPSADGYADWCMRWIGQEEAVCTTYWTHSIQWFAGRLLPDALLEWWSLRHFHLKRQKGMSIMI
ncbi:putative oxidoreductase [Nymphaea thermarum]|nr:putative oxidoreductase [Nymphaea thermarum]